MLFLAVVMVLGKESRPSRLPVKKIAVESRNLVNFPLLPGSVGPPWEMCCPDRQDGSGRVGVELNCRLDLHAVPCLSPKLISLLAVGIIGNEEISA